MRTASTKRRNLKSHPLVASRMPIIDSSNVGFLKNHDEQLVRLGQLAERYFPEDPNTCLLKLRQLAELLAQLTATRVGVYVSAEEK
jgi:hypothetical protein